MGLFDKITIKNFNAFALQHYDDPQCEDIEDFYTNDSSSTSSSTDNSSGESFYSYFDDDESDHEIGEDGNFVGIETIGYDTPNGVINVAVLN